MLLQPTGHVLPIATNCGRPGMNLLVKLLSGDFSFMFVVQSDRVLRKG